MLEKLIVIFKIPELRRKIFFTLLLLAIFRIGFHINLPMIDSARLANLESPADSPLASLLNQAAMFSAADLRQITIFGLGIMPYISASIIFQLLASVWAPLEKLQKEGESGRKKINEYTRYATIAICLLQSWFYLGAAKYMTGQESIFLAQFVNAAGNLKLHWHITAVLIMTCGTAFLMWLGEQIDAYGIGNGISLLIMAGILARMPQPLLQIAYNISQGGLNVTGDVGVSAVQLLLLVVLFLAVVTGVVFITLGQRRIPTQSAKHVRGRKVFGGMRQYLPMKVNQAGVMPIIFASSLLLIPQWICNLPVIAHSNYVGFLATWFSGEHGFVYNISYIGLIFFFCYFWTAITFNPKDMADNLKNNGTMIIGHRPGKPTANYLEKVMIHITYVGAAFLALVAILPTILAQWLEIPYDLASFYGGTGLLIAVSVAFDMVQKIDSHLVMRNYKGLLEK